MTQAVLYFLSIRNKSDVFKKLIACIKCSEQSHLQRDGCHLQDQENNYVFNAAFTPVHLFDNLSY